MPILCKLVNVYLLILFATAILSWFPNSGGVVGEIRTVLRKITEPVVGIVRRAMPFRTGGIDLSFLVVVFGLRILQQQVLCR